MTLRRPAPSSASMSAIEPMPPLTVISTPAKDPRKKLDYTATSTFNDRQLGNVRQTCDYDSHDNPVDCQLQVVDESVQPPLTRRYTIKNSIEYY